MESVGVGHYYKSGPFCDVGFIGWQFARIHGFDIFAIIMHTYCIYFTSFNKSSYSAVTSLVIERLISKKIYQQILVQHFKTEDFYI